jgi:BirA family transcriptional regulator, biotin operon repressor / biotin---[acetyl-CoA-carboxylase] ligase
MHSFQLSAINNAIAATPFANHLHHLATTTSTNDLALEAALSGARHGVWIADEQTAGRGRGGHTWHSAPGSEDAPAGLYMTALTAPPMPMQSAPSLSLRVAIAVQSAIASTYGFRAPTEIDIRWPNDLLLNRKKVGGILIDTASNPATPTHPATLRYAIIGVGINLNHTSFPPDLELIATSIRRELPTAAIREPFTRSVENSTKCPREPLAAAILLALDAELRTLTANPEPDTTNLATHSTWITNKRVRVEPRDGVPGYTGTTAGLNPAGFLLVHGDDGQLHTVLSGGLREP